MPLPSKSGSKGRPANRVSRRAVTSTRFHCSAGVNSSQIPDSGFIVLRYRFVPIVFFARYFSVSPLLVGFSSESSFIFAPVSAFEPPFSGRRSLVGQAQGQQNPGSLRT